MANNRLYIADTLNKKYIYISKSFGAGWREIDKDKIILINKLIASMDLISETDIKGKTSLRFFTEYDALHDEVFCENSEWEKIEA
jgi:hypothetical protein